MPGALALRNAVLRLAARDGLDMALAAPNELARALSPLICEIAREAQAVVLIGASTPGLVEDLASLISGEKRLTVAERDPALLPAALLAASKSASSGLRLSTEPVDLRIDPLICDRLVAEMKPTDYSGHVAVADCIAAHAAACPLVADESVDLVILDCMTNRLAEADAARTLSEAYRVLRRGGRVLQICLLADEPVRASDGAMEIGHWRAVRFPLEIEGASALASAGFHGAAYRSVLSRPVRIVEGVELRAFLMEAFKGKQGPCLDQGHAVIYRGPWSAVHDDDGHRFARGERTAVCAKTYDLLMRAPYDGQFVGLPAYAQVPLHLAPPFDCNVPAVRSPAVTKGKVSVHDGRPSDGASACCSS